MSLVGSGNTDIVTGCKASSGVLSIVRSDSRQVCINTVSLDYTCVLD